MYIQFLTVAAVAAMVASTASAALQVGATHVDHRATIATKYTGTHPVLDPGTSAPYDVTTTVLNSPSPGSVFSTYDGETGVRANFAAPLGTFRVDTTAFIGSFPNSGPNGRFTNGTMRFDIGPGTTFVPTYDPTSAPGTTRGTFTITNLDDGRFWSVRYEYSPSISIPLVFSGDLVGPAPQGQYELGWTTESAAISMNTYRSGYAILDIAVVPEPASLSSIGLATLLLRRRR